MFLTPARVQERLAKYLLPEGLNKPEECTTKRPRPLCATELSEPKSSDPALQEISTAPAAAGWAPTEARQAVSQISGQVVPLMGLTVT